MCRRDDAKIPRMLLDTDKRSAKGRMRMAVRIKHGLESVSAPPRLTDPGGPKRSDGEPQDVRVAGVQQYQSRREGDGDVRLRYQRGSSLERASLGARH